MCEPHGFNSYSEIQQWLNTELGVNIAYKSVYQLVRYKLGAKLKVPRPKSGKQHPQSQSTLKKTASGIQIFTGIRPESNIDAGSSQEERFK